MSIEHEIRWCSAPGWKRSHALDVSVAGARYSLCGVSPWTVWVKVGEADGKPRCKVCERKLKAFDVE